MAKEKKVIFEEIKMVEDTPDDLVMELFSQAFWPDHPLGRPILGTRQSVGGFERDEMAAFFRSVYHPGNVVIAAAGNLDHDRTSKLIVRHFGESVDRKERARQRPSAQVAREDRDRAPRRNWSRSTCASAVPPSARATPTATAPTS